MILVKKAKVRIRETVKWLLLVTPLRPLLRRLLMRPFWWLRYKTSRVDLSLPKVSIVMPVWNNKSMVGDAIRSARAQSWPNIELIVTNDGSTDGTGAYIEKFASSRVRIFHQENAGPGAARNNGIDQIAESKYLVFLDSDDLLPIHGVRRLVESAEASGSPLVIGRIERFDGVRRFQRKDNVHVYRASRQGITIDDEPGVLSDANISAKLFNLKFWNDKKLRFPEGVVYEDMTVVVAAYLSVPQFDIVSECVNMWRVRGEGRSITQRRNELKSLADRLTAVERIYNSVVEAETAKRISPLVRRTYLTRIITLDLQLFVVSVGAASPEFFDEFKSRAGKLLEAADEEVWNAARGAHKDLVRLAISGTREQVIKAIGAKGL
jgi:CDP-glycerol glycerophosphotransferase